MDGNAIAAGHEILPKPGTAYTMKGAHTGQPASLTNQTHYPVEAICRCGEVIRAEHVLDDWHHTGRKPGDPR